MAFHSAQPGCHASKARLALFMDTSCSTLPFNPRSHHKQPAYTAHSRLARHQVPSIHVTLTHDTLKEAQLKNGSRHDLGQPV